MAAGITPGEAGIILEPVQLVVDWALDSKHRELLDTEPETYEAYITQLKGEE